MAKEAGYKAAMHVIHHYPKLFPAYQPVPVSPVIKLVGLAMKSGLTRFVCNV